MISVLTLFVALILLAISTLHFYWGFGGTAGLRSALPQQPGKEPKYPSRVLTLFIAIGLLGMTGIVLGTTGLFPDVPMIAFDYSTVGLALVFLLRSVGDFNYFGLTRKVHNTQFAELDKKYYTPLCLLLSLGCGIIAYSGFSVTP